MRRQRQWKKFSEAFGSDKNSVILVELLATADDAVLAHRLLRRFSKTMTVIGSIRLGIEDPGQRAWLEQLVLRDTWRDVEANAPHEIAKRFYARVRRACRQPPVPRGLKIECGKSDHRERPERRIVNTEIGEVRRDGVTDRTVVN